MTTWRTLALKLIQELDTSGLNISSEASSIYNRLVLLESNGRLLLTGSCQIPLTQNQFATIDKEDFERVSQYSWFAVKQHYKSGLEYYARAKINGRAVPLHRFILGQDNIPEGMVVDHINQDPLDNRKENLRVVDKYQSMQNRRGWSNRKSKTSSEYKGVYYRSSKSKCSKPWRSVIKKNGIAYEVGSFETEREAALAYDRKALQLHGEYATLNFPEGDMDYGKESELSKSQDGEG